MIARETYGYAIIITILVAAGIYIVMGLLKKYQYDLYMRFVELSSRVEDIGLQHRRQKELDGQYERIQAKVELIHERLNSRQVNYNPGASIMASIIPGTSAFTFKGGRLFDAIDTDGDGVLTYKELNAVMELTPVQLTEFVKTMNEAAGMDDHAQIITKKTFCRHFLDALE